MSRRFVRCTLGLGGPLLALALAGCAGGMGRVANTVPPPDPPPIPQRKPAAAPRMAPVAQTASVSRPVAVSPPSRTPAPAARSATLVSYRVQPGDTVYGISRRLSVPLRGVIDTNGLKPPYILSVGRNLRIANPRRHVVRPGDTVYGIARTYGVEMSELVRFNRIEAPYTIAPGRVLILPVGRARPPLAPASVATAKTRIATSRAQSARPAPPKIAKTSTASKPKPAKRVAAIPKPPPRAGGKFLWPTRGKLITAYGPKKGGLYNDGINIAAPRGAPVRAADNGVVVYRGNELRGFGNLILVKHAGGWVTAYAHNGTFLVRRGERVKRGQVIAKVGSTGNVTRPQLHFEIRKGTRAVNPTRFLGRQNAARG